MVIKDKSFVHVQSLITGEFPSSLVQVPFV